MTTPKEKQQLEKAITFIENVVSLSDLNTHGDFDSSVVTILSAAKRVPELEQKLAAININHYHFCPHCAYPLIHANPSDGAIDTYCEECGWPDEERK